MPGPTGLPIRYLDPSTIRRRAGRRATSPTWYVADRLLVGGSLPDSIRARLRVPDGEDPARPALLDVEPADDASATRVEREAGRQGCRLGVEVRYRTHGDGPGPAGGAGAAPLGIVDDAQGFVLRLLADAGDRRPDAWGVLEADADDDSTGWRLDLDHVMSALPFTSQPFTSQPFTSQPFTSQGMVEYAQPGSGGRAPVQWLGAPPARRTRDDGDVRRTPTGATRPVVAIVDSGIGSHRWFGPEPGHPGGEDAGVVLRHALPDGPIGTLPPAPTDAEDAEIGGTGTSPLTGPLDPIAGHGTFIAGIVHQTCPDALLLPVRVVDGSGVTAESEVIESLRRLLRFHRRGVDGVEDAVPVDVVVLPMGYYHEEPDDLRWDHPLADVLARLRDAGVAVVVAAGNDGQTRPSFPAAFAPEVDRRAEPPRITLAKDAGPSRPPILTVGAANPDGSTALFSNDGPWVTCVRPGAAVVSTMPETLDGPSTPSVRLKERHADAHRSTIDPEGFQGGFATWSGTSFAAPVLAGQVAAALLEERERRGSRDASLPEYGGSPGTADERSVAAIWSAIGEATGGLRT